MKCLFYVSCALQQKTDSTSQSRRNCQSSVYINEVYSEVNIPVKGRKENGTRMVMNFKYYHPIIIFKALDLILAFQNLIHLLYFSST